MEPPVHYLITGSAPLARGKLLCTALGGGTPRAEHVRATGLDTFDGRLRAAGRILSLERRGRHHVLTLRRAGSERLDFTGEVPRPPRFAADFPTAGLAKLAGRLLGPRALLPAASFDIERLCYGLHAPNGKLLTEILLERIDGPRLRRHYGSAMVVLRLRALRGYEAARDALADHLAHEPDLEPLPVDLAVFVAEAAGGAPHRYVTKPSVTLAPDCAAAAGAAAVLKANFAVMRANEWGIRADVDPEFLHDFRVAMRRMRSVFMDFRREFAPEDVDRFRAEFGWLNRVTGRPRDLDVMRAVLPERLAAAGIDAPLAAEIMARLEPLREAARAELLGALGGERYRGFAAAWGRLLGRAARTRSGAPPLAKRAARAIAKRHRRIIEHPWRPAAAGALDSMHALRKECKKLRYLLESFQSLYAPRAVKRAVGTLKTLQSAMGEAFDLHVQRALIAEIRPVAPGDPECAMLGEALIALDAAFAAAQARWIEAAAAALDDFRAASDRRLYRDLLRSTTP